MQDTAISTRLKIYFERHWGDHVVCVYLFGSAGRGEARPHSDLDIAVLYRSEPPHTLEGAGVRLAGELERITGKPVDVVVMNRAPVDLVHRVLRDGVLVYERDASARVKFEVRSRNLYFDIQPILERYRQGQTPERLMVDEDLILKKLSFIETCVAELRTLARPERIEEDIREERFISHTLQLAVQAALYVASHIVSDERLGEPHTNREMFDLLAKGGWLSAELTQTVRDMAGFRNILVHGYQSVDVLILRDIVDNRLDDLTSFADAVRSGMSR